MIKRCEICGSQFEPRIWNQKSCSKKCAGKRKRQVEAAYYDAKNKHRQKRKTRVERGTIAANTSKCVICGKSFNSEYHGQKYCSDKCRQDPCAVKLRLFFGIVFNAGKNGTFVPYDFSQYI